MSLIPNTTSAVVASVSGVAAAAASALLEGAQYLFTCSTACWIRQGTSRRLTVPAKASIVDGETVVITLAGASVTYEFDVAGNGVTAGNVQVNISADITAANVAARLKTAINADQAALTVTDPLDGTLTIDRPEARDLTVTENVANAGCTVVTGTMQATAGTGSMFVPAGFDIVLSGAFGAQLGIIQDAAAGKSSVVYARID